MTISLVRHKCAPECDDYCYSCNRHEPLPPEYHRMCGECFHVYLTEAELIAAHNAVLAEIREGDRKMIAEGGTIAPGFGPTRLEDLTPDVTSSDQIWSCPKCVHEF